MKCVLVTLKGDLGTKRFKLTCGWPQNDKPLVIADGTGLISGDKTQLANFYNGPALPKPSGLLQRPGNLDLIWQDNFLNFNATDSGYLPDGLSTPCWRSKLWHGRTQPDNKEVGYYADPAVTPAATPWLYLNGKLNLQAEYFPDGVRAANGDIILCPWDIVNGAQQPFRFTASLIQSQTLFNRFRRGMYAEARMTMPLVQGSWPALWFVPTDKSWPSIEIDCFEGFFNSAGTLAQVGTTVHYKNASNNAHAMFSSKLPFLGIDLTQPQTWGVHWGDDAVTFYCNDSPYMAVPNIFPDKDCYVQINVAVGGLVAKPTNPDTTFPVRMPLDWVKVWQ